jgi:hypothetical protein
MSQRGPVIYAVFAAPAPGRREPPIEATHMLTRSVTGADGYELGAALGDLLRNGAAPHGT